MVVNYNDGRRLSYVEVDERARQEEEEDSRPPCLNCTMITMGEAVSYADGSCPQCGRQDVGR